MFVCPEFWLASEGDQSQIRDFLYSSLRLKTYFPQIILISHPKDIDCENGFNSKEQDET